MKTIVENQQYDTIMEPSDWRYGASIVGLIRYFDYLRFQDDKIYYTYDEEQLQYNQSDINEENYLKFVEDYFEDDMHHRVVERCFVNNEFTEEQIKFINEKLVENKVLKDIFEKLKFDGSNKKIILENIDKNREEIIKETFRNKKNLYANFSKKKLLLTEEQPHCRLAGYNIDEGKKSKAISYRFDTDTFVSSDCIEFDFIPFGFSKVENGRENFFIHNNFTIRQLVETANRLQEKMDKEWELEKSKGKGINTRAALFKAIITSADFIKYDVEVIVKNRDHGYFETMYIRKSAIQILKKLEDHIRVLSYIHKVNENYYIHVQNQVVDAILNEIYLDDLIELFLKAKEKGGDFQYLISQLISINVKIKESILDRRGEKIMSDLGKEIDVARDCANKVIEKLDKRKQSNKINSYRQKLINAMVFHDYHRVCDILLQLSAYSEVSFKFAYNLYENFEENKELAYAFINALEKTKEEKSKNSGEKKGEQ